MPQSQYLWIIFLASNSKWAFILINDYISQIHYFCFVFFQYYSIKYRILVNLFIYSLLTSFQATLLTFLHCIWLKWANAHLDHQLMLSQIKRFTPHVFLLQKGKRWNPLSPVSIEHLSSHKLSALHNQHPKAQTPFSTQYFHIGLCGKAAPSRSAAHPISDARAPPIGHAYGCSMGSWKISPTAWRHSWTITCHLLEVAEVTVILFFEPVAFKVEFHNLSIHTHHWCLLL